jgi:hypothetical protein
VLKVPVAPVNPAFEGVTIPDHSTKARKCLCVEHFGDRSQEVSR